MKLFEKTKISSLELRNRFVRSATWVGMAHADGSCSRRLIALMVELARGGVGLIISGHAYVAREGQASPLQLGVFSDELLPGLSRMAGAVHAAGGKIVLQLAHAGCHADPELTGRAPAGPSCFETEADAPCREMTTAEIEAVVEAFGRGAARALKAGFDGVQLHAAHGYLLSQFLSPFYNKRSDRYGGDIAGRCRIVLDILQSIRSLAGSAFPVMIKMNSSDYLESGLTVPEMLQTAGLLQLNGVDAIELSGGTRYSGRLHPIRTGKITPDREVFYREAAQAYKASIATPLMLVGGIRSYETARQLVTDGLTDYVALARPLIREPDLVKRWQAGDRRPSSCRSDNLCFRPARAGKGLYCIHAARKDKPGTV